MPSSALRDRLGQALLDFAWGEWAQMGVLAAAPRRSPWAQDPEALLLLTFEVGRDDPRLFDEVLDWLIVNEPVTSVRRLRTMCEGPDDTRIVGAVLEWVARQRRRPVPGAGRRRDDYGAPVAVFRGSSGSLPVADPIFEAWGLLRAPAEASGKAMHPKLTEPVNFAFRLRRLLGLSARSEAVRFLLTESVPSGSTVGAVAASAAYAKRNVQEALADLHASGTARVVTAGGEHRYSLERGSWAHLLGLVDEGIPFHRDWPQLLSALRRILQWLDDPGLSAHSRYMRASRARDLLEDLRPRLAHAGVAVAGFRRGEEAWGDLEETVENALEVLAPPDPRRWTAAASFQIYRDSTGDWRWRLHGANGRVVATSADSFATAANARASVARFREQAGSRPVYVRSDVAGNHRWEMLAANNRVLAVSAEAFSSVAAAERAAVVARDLALSAAGPYDS